MINNLKKVPFPIRNKFRIRNILNKFPYAPNRFVLESRDGRERTYHPTRWKALQRIKEICGESFIVKG
jgi:hypothetical protein